MGEGAQLHGGGEGDGAEGPGRPGRKAWQQAGGGPHTVIMPYGSDLGHSGTGRVVGTLCPGDHSQEIGVRWDLLPAFAEAAPNATALVINNCRRKSGADSSEKIQPKGSRVPCYSQGQRNHKRKAQMQQD